MKMMHTHCDLRLRSQNARIGIDCFVIKLTVSIRKARE